MEISSCYWLKKCLSSSCFSSLVRRKIHPSAGFTFFEILIVVAVMTIISAAGLRAWANYLSRSRDDARFADLERIRTALELYRLNTPSKYPLSSGKKASLSLLGPLELYLTDFPFDPLTSRGFYYYYWSNGTDYALCAKTERGTERSPCSKSGAKCTGNNDACTIGVTNP